MVCTQYGSILYIYANFQADSSIRSKVMRGPKISKVGHVTQATPTYESFCGPDAVGSVLYVCAKFEADTYIRSKVIRWSQNLEIWSRDPGHSHLGVILWSTRSRGPTSMPMPNLKQVTQFIQKL